MARRDMTCTDIGSWVGLSYSAVNLILNKVLHEDLKYSGEPEEDVRRYYR